MSKLGECQNLNFFVYMPLENEAVLALALSFVEFKIYNEKYNM